jgi:uncharacterized membrane protein
MWESLEHVGWVTVLANTGWMYATVSVVHYFTLLFFIGTIALVDLRILGVADRNQTLSLLADQLLPWTWIGFALAMISGFLLFTTDAGDYAPDHVFQAKMLVILLAVVFTVVVQVGLRKWNQLPAVPASAKVIAAVSLILWLGAILAGVDIAALSGLG